MPNDSQPPGIGPAVVVVIGEVFAEAHGANPGGLEAFEHHDAVDAVEAHDESDVRPDRAGGALDEGGEDPGAGAEQHVAGAQLRTQVGVGDRRDGGEFVAEEGHGGRRSSFEFELEKVGVPRLRGRE